MKIKILIGLPCSGKTWLANRLSLGILPIHDDSVCIGEDILSYYTLSELKNGYILIHPFLTVKEILKKEINWIKNSFNRKNLSIECIYFENNPQKCMENLKYRMRSGDTRNVEMTIKSLTLRYVIPENVNPVLIWSINANK